MPLEVHQLPSIYSLHDAGHTMLKGIQKISVEDNKHLRHLIQEISIDKRTSNSHSVCMIYITCKASTVTKLDGRLGTLGDRRTTGMLNLVDLATPQRHLVIDSTERRRCDVQKSLGALGDVCAALASKHGHIPYRNSKLTHLLQPCLSNKGKTWMIINISPGYKSLKASLEALNFATRIRQPSTRKKQQRSNKPLDQDYTTVSPNKDLPKDVPMEIPHPERLARKRKCDVSFIFPLLLKRPCMHHHCH